MDTNTGERDSRLGEIVRLLQAGRIQDAILDCKEFNRENPDSAAGWHMASQLALKIEEHHAAVSAIDIAIELEPLNPQWQVQKAHCHIAAGEMQSARTIAGVIASRSYSRAGAASAGAELLTQLGMYVEAQKKYADAANQAPDSAMHQFNLAAALKLTGDLDEAERRLDLAIEIEPANAEAWVLRTGLRKQSRESNHIAGLRGLLLALEGQPGQKAAVLHALSKELDDIGEFTESFHTLDEANKLQREQFQYDVRGDVERMALASRIYSEEALRDGAEGFDRAGAIFLIGLPRSGVTLVERILGRHSVVRPIGQSGLFGELPGIHNTQNQPGDTPVSIENWSAPASLDLEQIGQAYFDASEFLRGGHANFVDSTPENCVYAGLIHLALPRARIIQLQRHPLDACYAIFRTQLDARFPYSANLPEIADYYIAYSNLMSHWHSTIPENVLQVRYEDLIVKSEQTLRKMFAFCDLSWEEQCMDFLESEESVAVEKLEIYQESIDRWQNYEKQLIPIAEKLERAGISLA